MAPTLIFLLFIAFVNAEADLASKAYLPPSRYHSGYVTSSYPTASGRTKDESYRYSGLTGTAHTIKYYSSKYPSSDFTTGREAWNPSPSWNGTYTRYHNQYVRPNYYPDSVEGSYSMYQYQHARSPVTYKKTSPYYSKIVKAPEKPKLKPQIAYYPMGYKKTNYPRIHSPYTMHKYPTKKIVHPYYRRYYQAYAAMPSSDMLRNRVKNIYAEPESSTSSTSATTTEDRNDYSVTSEDYTNYNDTYPTRSNGYSAYYDNYEEQTTAEPSAASYDETSTRGYYGDRIYMSSHGAPHGSDNGFRHRIYVARNEPEEEDSDETIFD